MKSEAQRIAIAEECGFKPNGTGLWFKNRRAYGLVEEAEDPENCGGIGGEYLPAIPDYLNDLNATDKMEEHLHGQEWANYFDAIRT